MRTQFRIIALFLFTSSYLFGQKEILYSENFETNAATTALLMFNIGGGTVEIEESKDDKFYIEHSIEFENYSKRKKEKIIDNIKNKYVVTSKIKENHIITSYENILNKRSLFFLDSYVNSKYIRPISIDSIIKHKPYNILISELEETKTSRFYFINSISKSKYFSESRKQRIIERYGKETNEKTYHVKVKVKIPKNLNVTINSKFTKIVLSGNFKNEFSIRCNGGRLFTDGFENSNNVLKVKDGIIIMKSMIGGKLILNNSRNAVIGELKNVKLNSEFSQLEIGKISSNVEITDFTSKFLIHNFSEDFGNFKMNTEYSEINLFYPKNKDYYNETFGYNTVHYINNAISKTPTQSKNKFSKMLVLGNETSPNKIKINTTHGIIRFGEDFINIEE